MVESKRFFIPFAPSGTDEAAFQELAAWCHRPVPAPDERIRSISFRHDGVDWTATVGEQLQGIRETTTRRKGGGVNTKRDMLRDNATVVAIFAGAPFMVATNSPPVRSAWVNPFMAGDIKSVRYFEKP